MGDGVKGRAGAADEDDGVVVEAISAAMLPLIPKRIFRVVYGGPNRNAQQDYVWAHSYAPRKSSVSFFSIDKDPVTAGGAIYRPMRTIWNPQEVEDVTATMPASQSEGISH